MLEGELGHGGVPRERVEEGIRVELPSVLEGGVEFGGSGFSTSSTGPDETNGTADSCADASDC